MDKLVTVIIPAWNAERYLEATLESLLNQSHRALRILVVESETHRPRYLHGRLSGWLYHLDGRRKGLRLGIQGDERR